MLFEHRTRLLRRISAAGRVVIWKWITQRATAANGSLAEHNATGLVEEKVSGGFPLKSKKVEYAQRNLWPGLLI
jgi:hypothetical protein